MRNVLRHAVNYARFRVWNTSSHVILTADYINTAVFCKLYILRVHHAGIVFGAARARAPTEFNAACLRAPKLALRY
jgi:hypothetical protein